MMPPHIQPVLRELEASLRTTFEGRLRDVRLFGSYARGEAMEDSDVDVLVLVDRMTAHEIREISDIVSAVALHRRLLLAVLPMASERFEELRKAALGVAVEIERDGARA